LTLFGITGNAYEYMKKGNKLEYIDWRWVCFRAG